MLPSLRNSRQAQRPSHELIMIYFFRDTRDAGPGRQVVGIALAAIEFLQLRIVRIEFAGDFKTSRGIELRNSNRPRLCQ